MSKPISYFIDRAKECIRMARNAPTGKQSELLRLANEWLALGHEVQDDLEQPHKFN
jgi:cellobiose-specific phosphotransferase system component IIA